MPEPRLLRREALPCPGFWGILAILSVLATASPALAHRMMVFAFAEGDTIHTESKFVPDTPVRQGQVQVLEQKTGQVLLTGATDDKGKFSFTIPAEAAAQKMDLKIVVEAGMGHRGEWLIKAASYLPEDQAATTGSAPAPPPPTATPTPAAPGAQAVAVDQRMLEEALHKALERHLAPVREKLAELTVHRTSLTDIIGGIGYIIGFFGLWAYFQSQRKKDS
jgi:nickel transport protein